MKIGDSVVFKKRVRDDATGLFKISGWQGRVSKLYTFENEQEEEGDCIVEYDSITLQQMPKEYIRQYLKRKLDFRYNRVGLKHLEKVKPRDTEKDLLNTWADLDIKCNFMKILEEKKKEDLARKANNGNKTIRVRLATEEEIIKNTEIKKRRNIHNFKVGDSVRIKPGVKEYHFEQFDMGGWEGRIWDIDDGHSYSGEPGQISAELDFDSITLRQLPEKFIEKCLEEFIDFRGIDLWVYNVESATPRDTQEDVIAVRLELDKKYDYSIRLDLDEDEPEILLYMDDANSN
jgi:hypothetical protein